MDFTNTTSSLDVVTDFEYGGSTVVVEAHDLSRDEPVYMTALYITISILGIIGNSWVLFVIGSSASMRKRKNNWLIMNQVRLYLSKFVKTIFLFH